MDVTFCDVYDYIGLNVSEDGIFVHTIIRGNEGCYSMGNGGREWSAPAASAVGAGLSFQCKKWKREKRVSLTASA